MNENKMAQKDNNFFNKHKVAIFTLTSALYTVLTVSSSVFSNYYANKSVIENTYLTKLSLKYEEIQTRIEIKNEIEELLMLLEKSKNRVYEKNQKTIYKNEQSNILLEIDLAKRRNNFYYKIHTILSLSIVFFETSIFLIVFSLLKEKIIFWHLSLIFAFIGLVIFLFFFFLW